MVGGKVKRLVRCLFAAGFLFLGIGSSAAAVLAADSEASMTVGQVFSNTSGKEQDAEVSYVIKPEKASNPMPSNVSADGGFTLSGTEKKEFVFRYAKPGIFKYSVYCAQEPANGMFYDGTAYAVEVYAHRDDDGVLRPKLIIYLPDGTKLPTDKPEIEYKVYATDVSLQKKLSGGNKVNGVGDNLSWEVIYPMGPDLKRVIGGDIVYAKNMYIYDEMDPRLDYAPYAEISAYGQDDKEAYKLVRGKDYTEEYDRTKGVVTWYISDGEDGTYGTRRIADEQIKYLFVKIDTTVNEKARDSSKNIWNNAEIEFTNASGDPFEHEIFNPDDFKDTDNLPDGVPIAVVGSVKVRTLEENEDGSTGGIIAGAVYGVAASKEDAEKGIFITGLERCVSDSDGLIELDGLSPGTYYLVEREVPEGYLPLNEFIELVVGEGEGENNQEYIVTVPKRPTASPTASPTATPTATPTVTLKPTATPTITTTLTAKPTSTSTPKGDGSLKGNGVIKTGDTNKPIVFIVMGALAIAAIIFLLFKRKEKEGEQS